MTILPPVAPIQSDCLNADFRKSFHLTQVPEDSAWNNFLERLESSLLDQDDCFRTARGLGGQLLTIFNDTAFATAVESFPNQRELLFTRLTAAKDSESALDLKTLFDECRKSETPQIIPTEKIPQELINSYRSFLKDALPFAPPNSINALARHLAVNPTLVPCSLKPVEPQKEEVADLDENIEIWSTVPLIEFKDAKDRRLAQLQIYKDQKAAVEKHYEKSLAQYQQALEAHTAAVTKLNAELPNFIKIHAGDKFPWLKAKYDTFTTKNFREVTETLQRIQKASSDDISSFLTSIGFQSHANGFTNLRDYMVGRFFWIAIDKRTNQTVFADIAKEYLKDNFDTEDVSLSNLTTAEAFNSARKKCKRKPDDLAADFIQKRFGDKTLDAEQTKLKKQFQDYITPHIREFSNENGELIELWTKEYNAHVVAFLDNLYPAGKGIVPLDKIDRPLDLFKAAKEYQAAAKPAPQITTAKKTELTPAPQKPQKPKTIFGLLFGCGTNMGAQ